MAKRRALYGYGGWVIAVSVVCGLIPLLPSCGSESTNGDGDDGGSSSGASSGSTSGSSGTSSGSTSGDPTVTGLVVEPPSTTLEPVGATPKTVKLVAKGLPSGTPVNATWSVDNKLPGAIDATGLYTTSNKAGGDVTVTATYQGKSATAKIKVIYTAVITSGSTPPNPGSLFDPVGKTVDTTSASVPGLVYPVNDTMFPQNIYRVLFQWAGKGMPLFQLSFTSPLAKAEIYTDGVQATCTKAQNGGSCWESDVASWTALAASNAGQLVTLKIRSINPAAPTTIYESPAYTVRFSKNPVPGAIYYWSTTSAGVRRGALEDPFPQDFLTPDQAKNNCVACHTLSRNGKRLAADVGGENLSVVEVSPTTPPPSKFGVLSTPSVKISSSWATFNPDTSRIVSGKKGILTLRNGDTGAAIGAALPLGNNVKGAQPDWSPDGKHVVYQRSDDDRGGGTTIDWISYSAGDVWGATATLVPAAANTLYGYPMFNSNSDYIAFVKGKSVEKDLTDQLWIVQAAPAGAQVALARANTLVNDGTVASGIENNMPTWAPPSTGDVQWVAFASLRDYGYVLRTGSKVGADMKQLWIAAIDPAKLGTGLDPSFPAFRVPFTDLDENCHRPFWALDAVKPPGGDAGAPKDAGPCVDFGGDCSMGKCCAGYQCIGDPQGNDYTCRFP